MSTSTAGIDTPITAASPERDAFAHWSTDEAVAAAMHRIRRAERRRLTKAGAFLVAHQHNDHDLWPLISQPGVTWCRTCQVHFTTGETS